MRTYAILVKSPLSGNTIQIDVYLTPGEHTRQHMVHLAAHDEIIGYIIRPKFQGPHFAVVYSDDQENVVLPGMPYRLDAMCEMIQYLADRDDWRLDLHWREIAG